MQTLSVIGVEDGAILAAAENGERFRIPVDESVRVRLADAGSPNAKRLSPREIQAHVRAGLSVEQVAAMTGASVTSVERFVRPVLAEKSFVLESAMRVRVQPLGEDGTTTTFGEAMAERFEALHATGVEWSSLKEQGGPWAVAVAFRADGIDHRARWSFDPKRQTLTPDDLEAATLSQQGTPAALSPRLHAVEPTGPVAVPGTAPEEPDRSRFDSAVFELPDLAEGAPPAKPTADLQEARARKRIERDAVDSGALAITRALQAVPEEPVEAAPAAAAQPAPAREPRAERIVPQAPPAELKRPRERVPQPDAQRRTKPVPRIDGPRPDHARHVGQDAAPARTTSAASSFTRPRRGRTSLPSWDEIVFGKPEE